MPQTPDFEKIAARTVPPDQTRAVAEQLRMMWNARGAADIVRIEASLSSMMGVTASGPYVQNLDEALKALDVPPPARS